MTEQVNLDRRSVLRLVGGATAASAAGGLATGSAFAGHADGKAVRVDQVGYPADGQKIAVVTSGSDLDPTSVSNFEIRDANTGETIETMSLSEAYDDASSGHTVKHADFSEFNQEGEFVVAAGGHESHSFRIGSAADVYGDLLSKVGRLYTLKRCNADIQDPVTGLDIGPGHEKDENAILAEPAGENYLSNVERSAGDTIDVSGGWYDAGDYGKYVTPAAVSCGQMLLAYERHPEVFTEGQFQIPDSIDDPDVGTMPDVLAEAKKCLEWLQKMQRSDGGLYYIVGPAGSFAEFVKPENANQDRYVFGLSSAGTAMACANFAQAARIYQGIDDQFAAEMLENAEQAFGFLENNSEVVWQKGVDQEGGTGPYTRNSQDATDRYWAAAEMLRTTGEGKYDQFIQDLPTVTNDQDQQVSVLEHTAPIDWNDPVVLGHYAYYQADGEQADTVVSTMESVAYGLQSLHADSSGNFEAYGTGLYAYYWGCVKSGVGRGMAGVLGMEMVDYEDPAVEAWSIEPVHHMLGRSATGYSYMSGAGENHIQNPHDRIVASTGILPAGMVVGGPNPNPDACGTEHIPSDAPDALSYVDEQCEYSTNEWAINYTAPVFLMLAELVGRSGEAPDPNPNPTPEDAEVSVELASDSTAPSGQVDARIAIDSVPDGVSGYDVSVSVSDPSVAQITGAEYPSGLFNQGVTVADDGSSVSLQAVDGSESIQSGATDVHLATVSLAAQAGGQTDVSITIDSLDSDANGADIPATTTADTLTVASVSRIDGEMPTDIDGDGKFEDLNGNGELDSDDVVVFFNRYDEAVITDHVSAYDYNDSGGIDFDDIVQLFNEL